MRTKAFIFALITTLFLQSCSSVRVTTDYDSTTNFNEFKTFAFYKPGIDKAEISDLDKRRIMRFISEELEAKGMRKSETPDVLVSLFTKAQEKVKIYEPYWAPYYSPYHRTQISKYTEGTLFIDIIDSEGKKLIWQGVGSGFLTKSHKVEKREANIQKFVQEILEEYPPEKK
jgi:hypothetical protein